MRAVLALAALAACVIARAPAGRGASELSYSRSPLADANAAWIARDQRPLSSSNSTSNVLWPKPASVSSDTSTLLYLDPLSFRFVATGPGASSDVLNRGLNRYAQLTFPYAVDVEATGERDWGASTAGTLLKLEVIVNSPDEYLGLSTDESYSLNVTTSGGSLVANSPYGALRGLETFSQCVMYDVAQRTYSMNPTTINDYPRFPYRGV
jgi:hypothetical protein